MTQDHLTRETLLPIEINLTSGPTIRTVGEAERFLSRLTDEQQDLSHWEIAARMFANAVREPAYLKAAAMSLRTAAVLDGLLAQPRDG